MICILPFHKHEKVNADDESKTNNKENAISRTGHMEDVTLSFFLLSPFTDFHSNKRVHTCIHISLQLSESKGMKRTESKQKHEMGRLTN